MNKELLKNLVITLAVLRARECEAEGTLSDFTAHEIVDDALYLFDLDEWESLSEADANEIINLAVKAILSMKGGR